MTIEKSQIEGLNYGYDLDGGGYTFEQPPKCFGDTCVMWEDPDRDYLGIQDCTPNWYSQDCPVFLFAPHDWHSEEYEFPETYTSDDGDSVFHKVYEGRMNATDHECHCHGVLTAWSGAAGEPTEPMTGAAVAKAVKHGVALQDPSYDGDLYFEHTGNSSDKAYPDCHRCEGDGYVDSPGGWWAVYALQDG